MKTKSRFSRNVYAVSNRIWCNKYLRHTTTEKYVISAWLRYLTKWLKIRFWKFKFRDLSMFFNPFIAFPYYCSIWRRSCGDHMRPHCIRTASSWRPRRLHCAVTALPLWTHCVHTALIQIAVGTPSHGAHFVQPSFTRKMFPFDDVIMKCPSYGQRPSWTTRQVEPWRIAKINCR